MNKFYALCAGTPSGITEPTTIFKTLDEAVEALDDMLPRYGLENLTDEQKNTIENRVNDYCYNEASECFYKDSSVAFVYIISKVDVATYPSYCIGFVIEYNLRTPLHFCGRVYDSDKERAQKYILEWMSETREGDAIIKEENGRHCLYNFAQEKPCKPYGILTQFVFA